MASEWYYAKNDEQKGPVTFEALKGLAADGTLRPKDLVWKAGMPDWVPAQTQTGLFGETVVPAKRIRPDEDDEDRPRSRSSSRRRPRQEGMSTALKFGLIAGGASLVLLVVCAGVIGVIIAVAASKEEKTVNTNPPPVRINQPANKGPQQPLAQAQQPGERNWNLGVGQEQTWTIRFNQGDNVVIRVQSNFDSDVDLFVLKDKAKFDQLLRGEIEKLAPTLCIAFDNGPSKDCEVQFIAPQTRDYYVVVVNRQLLDDVARNRPNNGKLTFSPVR
jgi:hypothetical protein